MFFFLVYISCILFFRNLEASDSCDWIYGTRNSKKWIAFHTDLSPLNVSTDKNYKSHNGGATIFRHYLWSLFPKDASLSNDFKTVRRFMIIAAMELALEGYDAINPLYLNHQNNATTAILNAIHFERCDLTVVKTIGVIGGEDSEFAANIGLVFSSKNSDFDFFSIGATMTQFINKDRPRSYTSVPIDKYHIKAILETMNDLNLKYYSLLYSTSRYASSNFKVFITTAAKTKYSGICRDFIHGISLSDNATLSIKNYVNILKDSSKSRVIVAFLEDYYYNILFEHLNELNENFVILTADNFNHYASSSMKISTNDSFFEKSVFINVGSSVLYNIDKKDNILWNSLKDHIKGLKNNFNAFNIDQDIWYRYFKKIRMNSLTYIATRLIVQKIHHIPRHNSFTNCVELNGEKYCMLKGNRFVSSLLDVSIYNGENINPYIIANMKTDKAVDLVSGLKWIVKRTVLSDKFQNILKFQIALGEEDRPEYTCSQPCNIGYYRKYSVNRCCFKCDKASDNEVIIGNKAIKCTKDEWPDYYRKICKKKEDNWISYGHNASGIIYNFILVVQIIFVLGFLTINITNKKHPLVVQTNLIWTILTICGLLVVVVSLSIRIQKPSVIMCVLSGVSYSCAKFVYDSIAIVKTIRATRILKANQNTKDIGDKSFYFRDNLIIICSVAATSILNVITISLDDINYKHLIQKTTELLYPYYFIACTDETYQIIPICMSQMTTIIGLVLSYRLRHEALNFNEQYYLSKYFNSIWIIAVIKIPLYMIIVNYRVHVIIICNLIEMTVALIFLCSPQCFAILFVQTSNIVLAAKVSDSYPTNPTELTQNITKGKIATCGYGETTEYSTYCNDSKIQQNSTCVFKKPSVSKDEVTSVRDVSCHDEKENALIELLKKYEMVENSSSRVSQYNNEDKDKNSFEDSSKNDTEKFND